MARETLGRQEGWGLPHPSAFSLRNRLGMMRTHPADAQMPHAPWEPRCIQGHRWAEYQIWCILGEVSAGHGTGKSIMHKEFMINGKCHRN